MKKIFNKNNLYLIIPVFQIILSFFFDYYIFKRQGNDSIPLIQSWTIICKFITFILLTIFWNSIFKKKIKNYKFILIYGAILFIMFLIVYPGIWRWDDIINLGSTTSGKLYYWQHWISSAYFYICMSIIPIPAGIVLIQITIISIIVGHIIGTCYEKYGKKALLLFIIFLLPAVIDSCYYPIRANLCAFLELYLIFELLYGNYSNNNMIKILLLVILASTISVWRPENFIYILIIPIILIFNYKINYKKLIVIIIIGIFSSFLMISYQKKGLSERSWISETGEELSENELYSLSGFVTPFGELVKLEYNINPDSTILKEIDKIISVEKIVNMSGLGAFWNNGTKSISSSKLKTLEKKYVQLILKYPGEFLNERFTMFKSANGYIPAETLSCGSAHIYDSDDENIVPKNVKDVYNEFKNRYIYNKPINENLRKKFISVLEMKEVNSYNIGDEKVKFFYNCTYSLISAIILCLISLIKKNWKLVLLILTVIAKLVIVFLTAPMPAFMYFFSTMLICSFFTLNFIIDLDLKKIKFNKIIDN